MKKKLNVLFIPSWYPSDDDIQNGVFIKKQAEVLSIDNNIYVIYFRGKNKTKIFKNQKNNLVEYIVDFKKSKLEIINIIRILKEFIKIKREIKIIDIIHSHVWSKKTVLSYFLSIILKVPLIISEHWSGHKREILFLEKKLIEFIFKRAKYIICVSNFLKKLLKNNGVQGNFKIVGNIIEKQKFKKIKETPFNFLIISDLRDKIKNISSVINVFNKLNLKNTRLSIIGDGPDKEKLIQISKNNINFLGRLSNEKVIKEITKHHCIIINSRIETFSIVALESLAAGKPIIYTKCGGIQENVSEDCGISISINNDKELEKAMINIKNKYNCYKPDILQKYIKPFDKEIFRKKINDIYINCIK